MRWKSKHPLIPFPGDRFALRYGWRWSFALYPVQVREWVIWLEPYESRFVQTGPEDGGTERRFIGGA